MNKRRWHLLIIAIIVIAIPTLFGIFSGFPVFGAMLFGSLGGFAMALGARFQPDFQYLTPLLAWHGSPREVFRRRIIWGLLGTFWMLTPMIGITLPMLLPDAASELAFNLWPAWLIGLPLITLAAVTLMLRRSSSALPPDMTAPFPAAHPNPGRLRTIGVMLLVVLGTQAAMQAISRVWGFDAAILFATFALGTVGVLTGIFWSYLERWFPPVTDHPPPASMNQRQRWLSVIIGVYCLGCGIAALTHLLDRSLLLSVVGIPSLAAMLLMGGDYWLWRLRRKPLPPETTY